MSMLSLLHKREHDVGKADISSQEKKYKTF